jgi:cellulose synthase/poly-beta-1,6-N-acetylglucosamine synthase-like glycosyltransferase
MRRFFEMIPALLAWLTLVLMFLFSWLIPVWVAIFIILFDTYWLLKTIFLSFHLRATFSEMKKNMKIDWLTRLENFSPSSRGSQRGSTPPNLPLAGEENFSPFFKGESEGVSSWQDIYHFVLLPMYNEPYEVVRESFVRLAAVHYPKDKMIVVLALEERAGAAAQETGERIKQEFGGMFLNFLTTTHPKDLPGEIPGKGSNESWAAQEAKRLIIDPMVGPHLTSPQRGEENFSPFSKGELEGVSYKNFLVSVFDIDTQVFPEYFGRLTYVYLTTHDPLHAIYQPVPFFTNNVYESQAFARFVSFSCTFWQMMQKSRPERLTSFSSQSIPFETLAQIGFWHKDIVSEDSRIFWQGLFRYHGDFRTEPLFFPVSMDVAAAPTLWGTVKNIYKQQRRWAWGSENVSYMLEKFRKDKTISRKKRWYWTFNTLEGYHSWSTNSLMIFALGWLPLFLGGKHFNETLLSYNLPHITRFIILLSMIGVASSAILSFLLLPPKPKGLGVSDYCIYFLQWLLMPLTLIFFGAVPGIEAQTRLALGGKWRLGFWVPPTSRGDTQKREGGRGNGSFPV